MTSFLYLDHLFHSWQNYFAHMSPGEGIWLIIGLLGQLMFATRFIVQWLYSERHQKSAIPISFWYLSLAGGLIVLLYGIHKIEPVIILGQTPGCLIYIRNLVLIRREKRHASTVV